MKTDTPLRTPGPDRFMLSILTVLVGLFLTATSVLAEPQAWPAWQAKTASGESFSSSQLDGKVVLVSVWGSWCPNCRKQMPVLSGLQKSLGEDRFKVLAFSLDRTEDVHRQFVTDNQIGVPSIFARSGSGLEVVKMLQRAAGPLEAVPTVLIYDKEGHLTHRLVGFFNRKQLEELIAPLL